MVSLKVRVLAASALFLTSCSGEVSATSRLSDQCSDVPDGAGRVTLVAADGAELGAAAVGAEKAPVGVVLVYGASQTLCDWLEEARGLAARSGSRVLVVDRRGKGATGGPEDLGKLEGDIGTGADWLRAQGASQVAIMGSSMGSVFALNAAGPGICAAIAVSPITSWEGFTWKRPSVPVWVAYEKDNANIADAAGKLKPERSLAVPGTDHSLELVEKHEDVRGFLAEAVRSCG